MFTERRAVSLAFLALALIVVAFVCFVWLQFAQDRVLHHLLGLGGVIGSLSCIFASWISVLVSKARELDERITKLEARSGDNRA